MQTNINQEQNLIQINIACEESEIQQGQNNQSKFKSKSMFNSYLVQDFKHQNHLIIRLNVL